MPTRTTYAVLIALVGVTLLFGGLGSAYQASGHQHTITNETHTVDYSQPSDLDAPAYTFEYSDSITVTADGQQLENNSDYVWQPANGSVEWLNSTATTDGEQALVDYSYVAPSEGAHNRKQVLWPVLSITPWAALAVGVYATIDLAGDWW